MPRKDFVPREGPPQTQDSVWYYEPALGATQTVHPDRGAHLRDPFRPRAPARDSETGRAHHVALEFAHTLVPGP